MSNPFAGWTQETADEHNRRVALGRMKGNSASELFEQAQRDRIKVNQETTELREKIFGGLRAGMTMAASQTVVEHLVQNPNGSVVVVSKNGRRRCSIGGKDCSFRSHWEVNFAHYLEHLKKEKVITDWDYEPQVFYFDGIRRGTTNYTPDFKLIYPGGRHEWREVKGWMSPQDKTKLKRMQKFFPEETIKIIDGEWFKKNGPALSVIVRGWSKKKK
jgi:hypothetical protein